MGVGYADDLDPVSILDRLSPSRPAFHSLIRVNELETADVTPDNDTPALNSRPYGVMAVGLALTPRRDVLLETSGQAVGGLGNLQGSVSIRFRF